MDKEIVSLVINLVFIVVFAKQDISGIQLEDATVNFTLIVLLVKEIIHVYPVKVDLIEILLEDVIVH